MRDLLATQLDVGHFNGGVFNVLGNVLKVGHLFLFLLLPITSLSVIMLYFYMNRLKKNRNWFWRQTQLPFRISTVCFWSIFVRGQPWRRLLNIYIYCTWYNRIIQVNISIHYTAYALTRTALRLAHNAEFLVFCIEYKLLESARVRWNARASLTAMAAATTHMSIRHTWILLSEHRKIIIQSYSMLQTCGCTCVSVCVCVTVRCDAVTPQRSETATTTTTTICLMLIYVSARVLSQIVFEALARKICARALSTTHETPTTTMYKPPPSAWRLLRVGSRRTVHALEHIIYVGA